MSDIFTSFIKVAWKLALTLTAVKCARYVLRRLSSRRIRITQYVSLYRQNAQLKFDLDEARLSVKQLLERIKREGERSHLEAERLCQEVGFWRHMEELARKELWTKDEALARAEVSLHAQTGRLEALESQLRESVRFAQERERGFVEERDNLQALLDAARRDLLDVQRRSEPDDPCSDADIIQLVRNLNVEISRTATLLTDSFHAEDARGGEGSVSALEHTRQAVGPIMAELLESIHHQDDPILVHIALQADMVGFAAGIVSAWDFQHQNNSTFNGIYKQMLKSETYSVSGRWRALTRQYSKQRLYNGRDLTEGFTTQLTERLSDILVVSGANADPAQMRRAVYQNLETIIRLAMDLQQVIGEQITSRDLEVVVVRMDDLYDAEQMEDVYGGDGLGGSEDDAESLHVLCTAALGLRRCDKPADGLGDELQITTLVKPKVVLETLVYELGLIEGGDAEETMSD